MISIAKRFALGYRQMAQASSVNRRTPVELEPKAF